MSKISSTFLKFPLHLLLFLTLVLPSLVISQDQTTLLNVKHQLGDPPSLRSWNSSSPPCTWPEIRCSGGAVTELHLSGKNITAYLPAAICDLVRLAQLNLSNNNIVGEFPTFLSNCSNIKLLDLSQNYLAGKIPNDIAKLKTLTYLDLGGNSFSGDVPVAIGALSELRTLLLYRNNFNGTFPKEIGNLTNLEVLGLAYNSFVNQTTPFEFGNLKNLKTMWLPMCNLVGSIPESFANLTSLELLDVSFNRLTGNIPSGLFALRNLQFLFLYRNGLSGEIPVLPGSVRAFNLNRVDLSMNNLTGSIPEGFGMLQNLTVLHLFSNQLTGEIPRSLGLTPTLKDLKVFGNKLNGTLPPELGLYAKLEYLEFGNNQLSGGLPQHLCDGGALKGLTAFSNNLSGELPQWMGNCRSLENVQLFNNNFSGDVPFGLWGLQNLTTLMLSNNLFSGQLPGELAWNLSRLEIRNNFFSGKISLGVTSAVNLAVFDARDNALSGKIPRALTRLSRLITLMLDGNQLNGELPSEIISWESLNTLSFSRNKLSGNIPEALCDLPDLIYLDLAENNITGEIPPQLGNLRLVFLNLSSNKLSGSVPYAFNNLAYENSFLDNPDLCAYNPYLNLSSCLAKKSTTPQTKNSSSKYLVLILVLTIIMVLATAFLVFCMVRIRKNCGKNHCGGDLSISNWKLTSFQRLNFTELNLFSSLTEENLIGCGGFGKVYRVASDRPGEYVAVKKIWNCMNLDERLEREFMAEVEILSTIRHSNVVKLLCCFSSENSKLLVYEYMENQSLDKWLHGRKRVLANGLSSPNKNCLVLKWPTRLGIAVGAAQGLCYMHHECSPPIVHRDVKSSNILMDSEFRATIADFGLARMLVKPGQPHTVVSNIAGSLGYIPPECAYSTKINEKADVYSFGVILLELVTGKEPYSEGQHTGNLVDWAWQHYREGKCLTNALDEEIREISYVEEMTAVFKLGLVCTSRLPSNRPSMKEILQVLHKCCYPSANGRRRVGIGFDIALLHGDTTYISNYKDSSKSTSENEESCLYSM